MQVKRKASDGFLPSVVVGVIIFTVLGLFGPALGTEPRFVGLAMVVATASAFGSAWIARQSANNILTIVAVSTAIIVTMITILSAFGNAPEGAKNADLIFAFVGGILWLVIFVATFNRRW